VTIAVVETITDLGVPGLVGAAVGALISHYAAKARGREEHERTVDLLVTQDERRTAQAMLDSVREIKNAINAGEVQSYGLLHNQWSDQLLAAARVIRNEELNERAKAGLYVIFLATLGRDGEFLSYPLLRGALDMEEWLEAWLRREEPPVAHLPRMDEITALVRQGGRIDLEPLEEVLIEKA
jgi:hypothetical protein